MAGIPRDTIAQLKSEFTDLYNDFNKKGGKAANREGTGFNEGTTARFRARLEAFYREAGGRTDRNDRQ